MVEVMDGFEYERLYVGSTAVHLYHYNNFEISAYLEYLTADEIERLLSFKHPNRRLEFVATRLLRHQLFGHEHIHYDSNGAPFIEGTGFISISHCKNYVGIAINEAFKIGLDLETPRDNILELAHKFLSENEKENFEISNKLEVTKIWSAKEALYKLAGRKKIHFSSELLLSKSSGKEWIGKIVNPDHYILAKLNIFEHKGNIVSINSEEIVTEQRDI